MVKDPREKTHTKPLQKMITTGSALLFFGGIGLFGKGSYDNEQIKKELNQLVPTLYSVDTSQQARREVADFEEKIENLILEGNVAQISALAEQTEVKKSIEKLRKDKKNHKERLITDYQLMEKKHPYEKQIGGFVSIMLGLIGMAFAPELSEKKVINTQKIRFLNLFFGLL